VTFLYKIIIHIDIQSRRGAKAWCVVDTVRSLL